MSTWRTIALVSLAANLLVAGAVIGGFAAGARFQPPGAADQPRAGGDRLIRAFVAAMPPEQRAETRRQISQTFAETRDLRKEAREAQMALARAVEAEPYDVAAVKAALARMRAADAGITGRFHDAVADRLATLSAEQRRVVLRTLLQRRAVRAAGFEGESPGDAATLAPGVGGPSVVTPAIAPRAAAAERHMGERPAGERRMGEGALTEEERRERMRRYLERRQAEREARQQDAPTQ